MRVTIPADLTKSFGIMAGETLLASLEPKGILFRRLNSKVTVEKVHCPKCGKKLFSEDLSRGSAGGILLTCPFCQCHAQIEKFDEL